MIPDRYTKIVAEGDWEELEYCESTENARRESVLLPPRRVTGPLHSTSVVQDPASEGMNESFNFDKPPNTAALSRKQYFFAGGEMSHRK